MSSSARSIRTVAPTALATALALGLGACGGGDGGQSGTGPANPPPTGDFELFVAGAVGELREGADDALFVPLDLRRGTDAGAETVTLSLAGATEVDAAGLEASFVDASLAPGETESGLLLRLPVTELPIRAQVRRLQLTAEGDSGTDLLTLDVTVAPTGAPDVYLLVGQSNMVGFSGDGTRQPDGADASDPRILQLNVTANDSRSEDASFTVASDWTDYAANVLPPPIVVAEDPLHVPAERIEDGKADQYIGLGLSFAKRALGRTDADVVLVPAAWSGSAFCANAGGPLGQWMAGPPENAEQAAVLGNTWLFDRAVTRANAALAETGGVLRGILWHQGESDANEACAPFYARNLERLAQGLRERIAGGRNVPFVVGTLSRGADERGDLSAFPAPKRTVDDALRDAPDRIPNAAVSVHDDLVPAQGYPCGNDSCIHFGPEALREMGARYDEALQRAAYAPPVTDAAGPAPIE